MDDLLALKVKCSKCGHTFIHRCENALICPPSENKDPDWDGIFLSSIVRCTRCGAEDDYELSPQARMKLLGEVLRSTFADEEVAPPDERVMVGIAQLWDKSLVKRPSQGIARLRQIADSQPKNGEAWRRLGNMCERYGTMDEAEAAWRTAVEVDPKEAEAAYSLAKSLWEHGKSEESLRFVGETLRRYPKAKLAPAYRRPLVEQILKIVREATALSVDSAALMVSWASGVATGHAVVTVSSIELRQIRHWDRLADLLASDDVMVVSIVSEIPAERPTILERILEGSMPLPGEPGMIPVGFSLRKRSRQAQVRKKKRKRRAR
jgi:tetratricopeptide (TPR) repeat protein